MLAPEEYTMKEGYKVTITKTVGSSWVDDFGNDIKTIKLSGSLYSYYFGNVPSSIGEISPIGISGLDEFFKLRYITSRFRDPNSQLNNSNLLSVFPEIDVLMSVVNNIKPTYDNIGIVYHDYDDNNHYEVIFTDSTWTRSKSDPYTINYSLELKTVGEYTNLYSLGVSLVRKKETLMGILTSTRDDINDTINDINSITTFPSQTQNDIKQLLNIANTAYNNIQNFLSGQIDDSTKLISSAQDLLNQLSSTQANMTMDLLSSKTDNITIVINNYETENPNYLIEDSNGIQLLADIAKLNISLSTLTSLDNYTSNILKSSNIADDKELDSDEFEKNIVGNNVTTPNQNTFVVKDILYYQIQQQDTLSKIALKFYGDYTKYNLISTINNVRTEDFLNDALLGQNIMIPLQTIINTKLLTNNLVYSKKLDVSTPNERKLQILGSDISLDQDREIIADGSGDLPMDYGEDCFVDNIIDRVLFPVGTLLPLHSDWGININLGDIPSSAALSKLIDNITKQVSADPRTQYAYVDKKNISMVADTIQINLKYKAYTGEEDNKNIAQQILAASSN